MSDHDIRALARGLAVLRYLNKTGGDTGPNIALQCGLSRPTTYRILTTLEEREVVSRSSDGNFYRPAIGARQLSEGLTDEAWAIWIATPYLYELQEQVIWPTDLATLEGDAMVIRETTHAVSPWSIDRDMVGSRRSMLCSSIGRAYLSFCPENEREQILELMSRSSNPDDVRMMRDSHIHTIIRDTVSRGYASRLYEKNRKTCSIAVPLIHGQRVLACMNVVWLSSALPYETAVARFVPPLQDMQARIEAKFRSSH